MKSIFNNILWKIFPVWQDIYTKSITPDSGEKPFKYGHDNKAFYVEVF